MFQFSEYTLPSGPNKGQKRPFLKLLDLEQGYQVGVVFSSPDHDGLPLVSFVTTQSGDSEGQVSEPVNEPNHPYHPSVVSDQGNFQVFGVNQEEPVAPEPIGTESTVPDPAVQSMQDN